MQKKFYNYKKNVKGAVLLEVILGISLFVIAIPILISALQSRSTKLEDATVAKEIKIIAEASNMLLYYERGSAAEGNKSKGVEKIKGKTLLDRLESFGIPSNFKFRTAEIFTDVNEYGLMIEYVFNDKGEFVDAVGYVYVRLMNRAVSEEIRLKKIVNAIGFQAGLLIPNSNKFDIFSPAGQSYKINSNVLKELTAGDYYIMMKLREDIILQDFLYTRALSETSFVENTMLAVLDMNGNSILDAKQMTVNEEINVHEKMEVNNVNSKEFKVLDNNELLTSEVNANVTGNLSTGAGSGVDIDTAYADHVTATGGSAFEETKTAGHITSGSAIIEEYFFKSFFVESSDEVEINNIDMFDEKLDIYVRNTGDTGVFKPTGDIKIVMGGTVGRQIEGLFINTVITSNTGESAFFLPNSTTVEDVYIQVPTNKKCDDTSVANGYNSATYDSNYISCCPSTVITNGGKYYCSISDLMIKTIRKLKDGVPHTGESTINRSDYGARKKYSDIITKFGEIDK